MHDAEREALRDLAGRNDCGLQTCEASECLLARGVVALLAESEPGEDTARAALSMLRHFREIGVKTVTVESVIALLEAPSFVEMKAAAKAHVSAPLSGEEEQELHELARSIEAENDRPASAPEVTDETRDYKVLVDPNYAENIEAHRRAKGQRDD